MKKQTIQPALYDVQWVGQSRHAGESMPLGGYDIGCNVWAENGDLLVYLAQSGAFDEEGRMCKAGRLRLSMTPALSAEGFVQTLRLEQGNILIQGRCGEIPVEILLWAQTNGSALHIEFSSESPVALVCGWETWRGENSTFENKDVITQKGDGLLAYHRNHKSGILWERLGEQGTEALAEHYPDVEKNRTFGALLWAAGMQPGDTATGLYAESPYCRYTLQTAAPVTEQKIVVLLHNSQPEKAETWVREITGKAQTVLESWQADLQAAQEWWHTFWQRSYVHIKPLTPNPQDKDWQVGRNYQLFRYMLGCNACGEYHTKFNGGLFTVDPILCSRREGFGSVCPDDRDWGGLIFTAQNQRLVYWPMLKNGDFDLMKPQFEFYTRILAAAKKRTEHFFGYQNVACFPEQLDANGLSAFYGKFGLDYPLQVRYHYVDAVEFCNMILCWHQAGGGDLTPYLELIDAVLGFYDVAYPQKDANGKRVIFPSTSLETFHATHTLNVFGRKGAEVADYDETHVAVTNPADVIAALDDTLALLLQTDCGTPAQRAGWQKLKNELPPLPTELKNGYRVIAPCEEPKAYVIGNCELPQLYTVYPYHSYGLTKPDLKLAVDTYRYSWEIADQLLAISWHQNGIFAARLGLAEEARRYMWLKLADAPRRFPAFWGPGHDYVPDHNWGGSGMIGVQEMLLQTVDGKILLLPAWPQDVDVSYKLWADGNTSVCVEYLGGKLAYTVEPAQRKADIILPDFLGKKE